MPISQYVILMQSPPIIKNIQTDFSPRRTTSTSWSDDRVLAASPIQPPAAPSTPPQTQTPQPSLRPTPPSPRRLHRHLPPTLHHPVLIPPPPARSQRLPLARP